jgi:inosine-uridine nucleoside N-ribohydrolase
VAQAGAVPKKIIIDGDPGHDDAIALLLAHGSPEIELLAVTTVMATRCWRTYLMGEPPGTVTIVPTAALTNVALAVRKEPRGRRAGTDRGP